MNPDFLWTTGTYTSAELGGIPLLNGSAPCAVAPVNHPTAHHHLPYASGTLEDGRRAYPFLTTYDAEAEAEFMNARIRG